MMVPTDALDAAAVVAAGRAAWPELGPAPAWVDAYLAAQLVGGRAPASAHAAEVALVCALAHGDPVAMRIFEATYVPTMREAVRRLRLAPDLEADVVQAMRVDLLVGDGRPRIADYAGWGDLHGWLAISASRRALRVLRSRHREVPLDDLLLEQALPARPGVDHAHLRATYGRVLKQAVAHAFAALEVRQRNLLRQHILDDLPIDDLAHLYRVHRATCARWLADARDQLAAAAKAAMTADLGVTPSELGSLLRLLDTDVELSLERLLRAG